MTAQRAVLPYLGQSWSNGGQKKNKFVQSLNSANRAEQVNSSRK